MLILRYYSVGHGLHYNIGRVLFPFAAEVDGLPTATVVDGCSYYSTHFGTIVTCVCVCVCTFGGLHGPQPNWELFVRLSTNGLFSNCNFCGPHSLPVIWRWDRVCNIFMRLKCICYPNEKNILAMLIPIVRSSLCSISRIPISERLG